MSHARGAFVVNRRQCLGGKIVDLDHFSAAAIAAAVSRSWAASAFMIKPLFTARLVDVADMRLVQAGHAKVMGRNGKKPEGATPGAPSRYRRWGGMRSGVRRSRAAEGSNRMAAQAPVSERARTGRAGADPAAGSRRKRKQAPRQSDWGNSRISHRTTWRWSASQLSMHHSTKGRSASFRRPSSCQRLSTADKR